MAEDFRHDLWLIYEQLKDAESDSDRRLELLEKSREELGKVINQINRQAEPGLYAAMANAGAKGGAAKTEAKVAAARANGKKGGRPAMTEEEKSILQWFRDKGFRVQLQIEPVNVSDDPEMPDNRPDQQEKYARVDRINQGAEPEFVRRYKMNASDNMLDSFKRAKELFEADLNSGDLN